MKNLSVLKAIGMVTAVILVGGGCTTSTDTEATIETKPMPAVQGTVETEVITDGGSTSGSGSGDLNQYEDPISNPTQP